MILDDIIAHKRLEVAERKARVPQATLTERPLYQAPRRGFRAALAREPSPAVVAELKRASPSRGVIRADYDPPSHARGYERAGARALSVLTDERFFGGALQHLEAARAATRLPCLRKDFVIDAYQLHEARAWGADAVLVIAAACPPSLAGELHVQARDLGLDVLVEVHTAEEMRWAVGAGADLIGVNNRDLATFVTTLETTERLAPLVPPGTLLVAESGISSRADVERMAAAGARAVLVGEAFMSRADPGAALAEWLACP